jgi:hypothetical protein
MKSQRSSRPSPTSTKRKAGYLFTPQMTRGLLLLGALPLAASLSLACSKKEEATPERVAPPEALAAAAPAAEAKSFTLKEQGSATFLIDAPLEKIKGTAEKFKGSLSVNPERLSQTSGQVEVNLGSLKTHTFGDAGKDAKQTEHAHSWLELGADVPAKEREENQWVRFTIKSVSVSPDKLEAVPEQGGLRTLEVTAQGELWLHGVTAPKAAKLKVVFTGPPGSPSEVHVTTVEPLRVSLKEHDVKPRDAAGKFLQGALEKIGDKIVDEVHISLDFKAAP